MKKSGLFAVAFAVVATFAGQAFAMPTATPIFASCANPSGGLSSTGTGELLVAGTVTCSPDSDRTSVAAIDFNMPASGTFYSLGLNGVLAFLIEPDFTGPGTIVEVTNPSNHYEAVDVYGSTDGSNWDFIERLVNNIGSPSETVDSFVVLSVYSYIGFHDVSKTVFPSTGSTDGYDIAAFSLTAVPLPATLPLMMGALGGLALVRRASRRA